MKRLSIILALVVVTLLAVGSFFYSSENVKPVETEFAKYPEISPFLAGRTGFRGIRFNLDTNYYSFAFPTHFASAATYFEAVDAAATKAGWHLASSTQQSRVYTSKKDVPVGSLQFVKVTVIYDSKKNEVTVVRENA